MVGKVCPETDRHPSPPVCVSSERKVIRGLATTATTSSQSITKSAWLSPIWLAASPTPRASYIDANISSTVSASASSNTVTGSALVRRTGSPS